MLEKKHYEKTITLSFLIKCLKRNILAILSFTLVFFCCTYTSLNFLTPKKYQVNGQLTNRNNITTTVLNTLTDTFKNETVLEKVVVSLTDNGIMHSNNTNITKSEILSGLSIPTSNNSFYITITYTNTDKTIIKDVLTETFNFVIDYLKNEAKRVEFSDLKVSKEVSDAVDISKTKQNVIVFTSCAFLLAYFISLCVDYKYDLVYDIDDVKDLNTNVLELNYTERKKEKYE